VGGRPLTDPARIRKIDSHGNPRGPSSARCAQPGRRQGRRTNAVFTIPLAERAPTPLSPLDADAQVAINFGRTIAADDEGTLHVVWFEDEGGPDSVWYRRSRDGGQTWEAPRHVAAVLQPQGTAVVAAAGPQVYIAWDDFTRGNGDIHLQRSTARGATWEAPFTLVGGPAPAFPSLAAFGDRVQLVWDDHRDGEHAELYTSGSRNGGESWALLSGFRARRTNPGCRQSL